MDFLDSLDLDASKYKKSRRVRSWYLYEQFRSLERNQLDATRQLKNRSYQDKILQQELSERKARRQLYDQFGLSQSETGIEHRFESNSTKVSHDDFFESFHDLDKDDLAQIVVQDLVDTTSQEDQQDNSDKFDENSSTTVEEPNEHSCADSVDSVINVKFEETGTNDMNKYLEIEHETNFEDIALGFDEVKEKLQTLERLTQLKDYDKHSDINTSFSIEDDKSEIKQISMKDKNVNTSEKNIYFMWSKLVSFASQVMQLNHGNCYHDYGSQFLTAVLACDVLRRGINKMCNILQLYVSPINYATDSKTEIEIPKNDDRRNPIKSKRLRRWNKYMRYYPNYRKLKSSLKLHRIANHRQISNEQPYWKQYNTNEDIEDHWPSKPWRNVTTVSLKRRKLAPKSSYRTIWPMISNPNTQKQFNNDCCACGCHKIGNPMLRLSAYLDRLMRDIDGPMSI